MIDKHTILPLMLGVIVGWLLASQFQCNPVPTLSLPTIPAAPKLVFQNRDTVTLTEVVYRDRWHVKEVPAETVTYDTTEAAAPSQPYTATFRSVSRHRDTIDVAFRHPEKLFTLTHIPRPDSVRTVTVTETNVIALPDAKRWGIGLHAGVGAQQDFNGNIRPGVGVSVGINFNVWEP